uniref:WIYLD domain-containing protein n=1 Tax=Leersia perrieri TaxID=77586 RepID=A0A0D9W312_9ORYZ
MELYIRVLPAVAVGGGQPLLHEQVYGDNAWLFLEEDSYRIVQETLFEKQEHEEQLQEEEGEEQEEEEPQMPYFLLSSLDDHITPMLLSF